VPGATNVAPALMLTSAAPVNQSTLLKSVPIITVFRTVAGADLDAQITRTLTDGAVAFSPGAQLGDFGMQECGI